MTGRAQRRFLPQLVVALVMALPGTCLGAAEYLGLPHPDLAPPLAALVYGIAIIGAAFTLSWAAEAAQVDISAGLALAVLALLAVLPEYAVDFVFSWQAGQIYGVGSLLLDAGADRIPNLALSGVYVALAVVELVRHRHVLARTVRDGLVTPFDELQEADEELAAGERP